MTRLKNATNAVKKINQATSGRKTYAAAIVFVLVRLFGDKVPFIVENQILIDQVIEISIGLGVFDKIRKKLPQWYKTIKAKIKK